jgi:beta-N-acetylhexosaminidase
MSVLSPAEAAGQTLVAGFPAAGPPPELQAAARRGELAGAVLFKRNLGAPAEIARLLARMAEQCPTDRPPLLAVDQEGGRVARLGPPVVRLPPMRQLGQWDDPELTRRAAQVLASQLRALGFTMDFAPVLDVDTNPENPVIGDRSFARTPEQVIRHGGAFAEGLTEGGVLPCGKHFPGHGDTELDSHLALPKLAHDHARLDRIELAPFRALVHAVPALMTAHVVFDALDPDVPATLSRSVVTGLLRERLGYDGVVISDDLEMKAVSEGWGVVDAAVAAIEAGCDLVLICSQVELCLEAHAALTRRAEKDAGFADRLQQAARRSLALRRRCPPQPIGDAERLGKALENQAARDLTEALRQRDGGPRGPLGLDGPGPGP